MTTRMTRVAIQLCMQDTKCSTMHILTVQEMEFKVKIRGKNENFTFNRCCVRECCTDCLAFAAVDSSHVQLADAEVACAALFMLLS